jgi:REP element-mobilizing transposase RayT
LTSKPVLSRWLIKLPFAVTAPGCTAKSEVPSIEGDHRYGTPDMPPNKKILSDEVRTLKSEPVLLDKRQRAVVDGAIREVCVQRKYSLYAVNVRTNKVHVVVGTSRTPEIVMNSFKSYATPKLREASLVSADLKPWARHGSTRYLWTEEQLSQGIEYVMFGQGNELFR